MANEGETLDLSVDDSKPFSSYSGGRRQKSKSKSQKRRKGGCGLASSAAMVGGNPPAPVPSEPEGKPSTYTSSLSMLGGRSRRARRSRRSRKSRKSRVQVRKSKRSVSRSKVFPNGLFRNVFK